MTLLVLTMTVFLTTLGLIGAAEMGDKTQLLTLALAARLPLRAVLGGVVVATLLNHALAVVVGHLEVDDGIHGFDSGVEWGVQYCH